MQYYDEYYESRVNFKLEETGFVTCHVRNVDGHSEIIANAIVNDFDYALGTWSSPDGQVASNTRVSLICGASVHLCTELNWYRDDVLVDNSTGL